MLVSKPCFLSFSTQNHAESLRNYIKKSVLDQNSAKLDQNSDFGHVRTSQTSPGGQVLVSKARFSSFFLRNYTFPSLLANLSFFRKSCLLLSKFIIVYKFIKIINLLWKMERCNFWGKNRKMCFADKDLSSWTGLGGTDMSEVRVLVQFRTFRVQNWLFEVISKSFCMVLRGEAQKARFRDPRT